ncbi:MULTISPECIES: TrmB family transcriptional regulator [unclassified Paenibacillus]|uniref:TrmB family transcriptional regulator n=1 Tax=unclassified Paenibacillus TaxID=185978 RepID=UPI0004030ED3|nr:MULTISPECIES: TrmB family transcriptional regulator [unclassified Paenibacillus]KGP79896.1 transcriptional regulator [Paenibacillus sp. MAEPY2]KGP87051.1 transcriptional regulator [Paenibacillus sp. MAEPY1]
MDQLLHHLRHLGFTEMESKIMVELARQGSASGYEVAKRLGVSRSNVYATLQRLEQRGFLRCSAGEPAKYSVLKPEEMASMISGQMRASLEYVQTSMPQHEPEKPVFYNIEGDKNVFENLSRELAEAKHEIVVDVWREEAELLRADLQRAEDRGVRLLWSCDGGEGIMDQPAPWPGLPSYGTGNGRKFSLVVDRRWCMVGMRGESCVTQAMVTEHPVMTGLLLNHFAQELVLYELEQDMGEELESRYGHRYQNLSARYWSVPSEGIKPD